MLSHGPHPRKVHRFLENRAQRWLSQSGRLPGQPGYGPPDQRLEPVQLGIVPLQVVLPPLNPSFERMRRRRLQLQPVQVLGDQVIHQGQRLGIDRGGFGVLLQELPQIAGPLARDPEDRHLVLRKKRGHWKPRHPGGFQEVETGW